GIAAREKTRCRRRQIQAEGTDRRCEIQMRHLPERNPVGPVENKQEIPDRAAVGKVRDSESSHQDSKGDYNQETCSYAKGISPADIADRLRICQQPTPRR